MRDIKERPEDIRGIRVSYPINIHNVELLEAYIVSVFYSSLTPGSYREFRICFTNKKAYQDSIEYMTLSNYFVNGDKIGSSFYAPNGVKIILMAEIINETKDNYSFESAVGNREATLDENWFLPGDTLIIVDDIKGKHDLLVVGKDGNLYDANTEQRVIYPREQKFKKAEVI